MTTAEVGEPSRKEMISVTVKGKRSRCKRDERITQDFVELHISEDMIEDSSWRTKIKQLDLISTVNEFHVLSSKDLSNLISDAENGIIKSTKNGSSFEINVESLARYLGLHISEHLFLFARDEQDFRYVLSGLRLLHTLYDIAYQYHHSTLEQVLIQDENVRKEMIHLIISIIITLSCLGQKIHGSNEMILLYSTLLASSLYLLRIVISSQWHTLTRVLLAHPEVDTFTIAAFTALRVVVNFLQEKLPAQQIDLHMKSKVNKVYRLCESSLQFLESLCKQLLFRKHIVKNKKLYEEGVILQLVKNILELPQCEDPYLMDVVYRLKSKVLSIMLLLCKVENASFLDMACSTTQNLELVESTVFEVLQVLKMMFCGDLKDHPRGILKLNAMRLIEIFSDDSRFRTYIILKTTEVLTLVFSQAQKEFIATWCSNDREPAEEDIIVKFDPISAAGEVLGLSSTSQVRLSHWSNFQAPQTPFTHQISSLLVKILAKLSKEENALFISEFLECLQTEFSKLPGGAVERIVAASRNLSSLSAHARSLTPNYLNVEDVKALRLFISQLEQLLATQESHTHRIQEVYHSGQCPSPTPRSPYPNEHDASDDHNDRVSAALTMLELRQSTSKKNGQ